MSAVRSSHAAILTEMARAVSAGDAKTYAELYAPDAVIAIASGNRLAGRDAIERYEVELLRQFPGTRLAFHRVWSKGNEAVAHYAVNGPAGDGPPIGHEGLLFYRFQPAGLIEEERRYNDSLTPMAQMGMLGRGPTRLLPDLPAAIQAHVACGLAEEETNVEVFRGLLAALDSRSEALFLSLIEQDAVVDETCLPRESRAAEWFKEWTRAISKAASEVTTIFGIGDFVLLESVVQGRLNGTFGRITGYGSSFVVHRAAVAHMKDGKVSRLTWFMNGKELAEAVGQWPLPVGST